MEERKVEFIIKVLKTAELSSEDSLLRDAAIHAAKRAYAPYSHFCVGAAALLGNGTVVCGSNQENAAYPSGMCAERVALFSAGSSFPDEQVVSMAIVALKDGCVQLSVSPCGGCRQTMLEAEQRYGRNIRVLLCGKDETIVAFSARDLLPLCFGKDNL